MGPGALLGTMLPTAVAVALSPLPVIAVVLLLVSRRGAGPALGYVAATMASTTVVLLVVAALAGLLPEDEGGGPDPVRAWITIGGGGVLLVLAVVQWVHRRGAAGEPASARWGALFDRVGVGHAVGLGALGVATNPKNLVLLLAAGLVLGEGVVSPPGATLVVVVFVLVASLGVLLPVGCALAFPGHAAAVLGPLRTWLLRHGVGLLVAVLVVVGIWQLVVGIGALR
jgi:hypothetical protein